MYSKYTTMKGNEIDWEAIRRKHEDQIALGGGGVRMNARGDILGKGGKVIKTREQLEKEYYTENPKAVKNVNIKNNLQPDKLLTPNIETATVFETPEQAVKRLEEEAQKAAAAKGEPEPEKMPGVTPEEARQQFEDSLIRIEEKKEPQAPKRTIEEKED